MISINAYSPAPQKSIGLTTTKLAAILTPLSQHGAVWFGHHEKKEMPTARLIRRLRYHMQKIIYGGRCLGRESVQGYLSLLTNPDNVHRPIFGQIKRCSLSLKKEVNTMSQSNSAQNSEQNQATSTSANLAPAKPQSCTSVELLTKLQQDIDSTIAALSATQLPAKQSEFFADEMRRAQVIHNTLKDNINDDDSLFISNVINRVMEILGEIRATAQTEQSKTRSVKLPDQYPTKEVENKDDFFVVVCKSDELMPTVWRDQLMLMRKNFKAEIGDVVMVNADHLSPRLEFCTVEGVYPAVCVAAKPQLLEILPDGTVSKAA